MCRESQTKFLTDVGDPSAQRTLRSPLSKIQLVDLILRSASGNEELLEKAKILVEEIYDSDRGVADFDLFVPILRFVGEEFGYLRETDDWSVSIKLAMIWAHAGKLFNLLQPSFGNDAGFRRWFWLLHMHSSTIFSDSAEYLNDCLHPRKISLPGLNIHGAAVLWATNQDADLQFVGAFEKVENAIVSNDKIQHRELFRSAQLNFNSTGSIFSGDRAEILSAFFRRESWQIFSEKNIKANVAESIEGLKTEQSKDSYWEALTITVGSAPIYNDLEEKVAGLISELDYSAILDENIGTAFKALAFIVTQTSVLTDELRLKCENWLFLLAKKLSDESEFPKKKIVTKKMFEYGYKLLEIAFNLSFRNKDTQQSGKKFKDLILGILSIWKEFGVIAEAPVVSMNFSLPIDQSSYLPEIILNIRASKPHNINFSVDSDQKGSD